MTTLIGGEMLLWSDLDATHGPAPAGGAALRTLLSEVSGRTLVAGPHDPALIDALPVGEVTVLVRGVADAEALAARYADRAGVTVWCGSVEKVAAVPAYDTVVALDGLDRLRSAEADDVPWEETLAHLVALLRAPGRLLLGVENLFGLHRLLALPAAPADTEWVVPDDHDPGRAGGPAGLRARLAAAGLRIDRDYAAYPGRSAPSVLLSREVLAEAELGGFLEATLATAATASVAEPVGAVLADPGRLVGGALRAGLAAELAPAWFVLATRPVEAGPAGRLTDVAARHSTVDGVTPAVSGTRGPDAVLAPDDEVREVRLPAGDLPRGRTLQSLLLAAAQRRDLPAVRELLSAWQAGPAAGVDAAQVVVAADGDHTGLAPAGEPLVALRRFATVLIDGGYAHLWPAPAEVAELTATLAGMTGRELDPADVPADRGTPVPAVRELVAARERLTRELAEARAKHAWYEQMLRGREAELKRVRQMNALLSATVPGRAATTLVGGLRAGRRAMRAVVRRARG